MLRSVRWNRLAPIALVAALSMPLSGCFGRFALVNTIYDFNKSGVSESPVVQEILFLAMLIVPVYGVGSIIDAFILNPIELLTGNNPLAKADGESRVIALDDGATLTITFSDAGLVLTHEADGVVDTHVIRQGDLGLEMYDEAGTFEVGTSRSIDGGLMLVDGEGRVLSQHSGAMLAQLDRAWQSQDRTALTTLLMMEGDGVCALD